MYLGRVIGSVVATQKYEGLEGKKLLLVTPLDQHLVRNGDDHVAVDTVRAGQDDLVYLVGSREAALALDPWFVPVDAAIVGIVDDIDAAKNKVGGMTLCRVEGSVVATAHHPAFDGKKLLVVQPVEGDGKKSAGASFLAVDDVQAGAGDLVLVMREGNGVRQLLRQGTQVPIRSLIVAIVDDVQVAE